MAHFLFVGLGNPGSTYHNTRHNAGWLAIDILLENWTADETNSITPSWKFEKKINAEVLKIAAQGHDITFIKPQTFMNDSGAAVSQALRWFLDTDTRDTQDQKLSQLIVFHDDLDIEIGKYKLQFNSGPKVHNGVNSVRNTVHTNAFWTARIGIDSRNGDRSIPGKAYVLQRFSPIEEIKLRAALKTLSEELPYLVLQ